MFWSLNRFLKLQVGPTLGVDQSWRFKTVKDKINNNNKYIHIYLYSIIFRFLNKIVFWNIEISIHTEDV